MFCVVPATPVLKVGAWVVPAPVVTVRAPPPVVLSARFKLCVPSPLVITFAFTPMPAI